MDWNPALVAIQDQEDLLRYHISVSFLRYQTIYEHHLIRMAWSEFIPGSVKTSLAAAISMNFFSAAFFSSPWKLSGCHCWAAFLCRLIFLSYATIKMSNVYLIIQYRVLKWMNTYIIYASWRSNEITCMLWQFLVCWHFAWRREFCNSLVSWLASVIFAPSANLL